MSTTDLSHWKIGVLRIASSLEVITGLVLVFFPDWAIKMLMGSYAIDSTETIAGRAMGCALLVLGVCCWRSIEKTRAGNKAILTLLLYNIFILPALILLGLVLQKVGILLWPAVILHTLLTGLLIYIWIKARSTKSF